METIQTQKQIWDGSAPETTSRPVPGLCELVKAFGAGEAGRPLLGWAPTKGVTVDGLNGVHHLAISTKDMKGQLEFFTDVLGAELRALYWMHGVPNTFHGFVKLNDTCYVAFVQSPANAEIEPVMGVSHAGNAGAPSAPGTMQHVAFNVKDLDELLAIRDRIRDRGINVFGPLDHGMCHSIYFAGPENLALEVATSEQAIDARAWIDPEVVGLLHIDDDLLAALKAPATFDGKGGAVPNPPVDWDKPQLRMPREALEALMRMPDEQVTARLSENVPPVLVTD